MADTSTASATTVDAPRDDITRVGIQRSTENHNATAVWVLGGLLLACVVIFVGSQNGWFRASQLASAPIAPAATPAVYSPPASAPANANLANLPWFEVGGQAPSQGVQDQAARQGWHLVKSQPGDPSCGLVEVNGHKVNRCPNKWVKD